MESTPDAETPPRVPPVTLSPDIGNQAETACQWFMNDISFCDKVKKAVRCDGNVGNCPFCK